MGIRSYSLGRRQAQRRQAQRRQAERRQAQDKTENPAPPAVSFWQRLDAGVGRARSLALSGAVLLVLGVLGWTVGAELIRNPIIIEPILVPQAAVENGWSGEVLARQIRDHVRAITLHRRESSLFGRDEVLFDREQLDVVLPGALVSIRTLVTIIRSMLDQPSRRVSAEIIVASGLPAATGCASTPEAKYRLVGRLSTGKQSWHLCGNMDDLPQQVAEKLIEDTNPYQLAVYFLESNEQRARRLAEAILHDPEARKEHARATALLGVLLHRQNKFDLAITEYDRAIKIDPDVAQFYLNKGIYYQQNQDIDSAIREYQKAIFLDSDNKDARHSIASAYFNKQKYDLVDRV
jgi:tetratricopeptide (TPR) repeat protein